MNIYLMFLLLFLTVAVAICAGLLVFDYWKGHTKTIEAMKKEFDVLWNFRKEILFGGDAAIPNSFTNYVFRHREAMDEQNKKAFLAFAEKIDQLEEAHKGWAQTFTDELQLLRSDAGIINSNISDLKTGLGSLKERHEDLASDFINMVHKPKEIELKTASPLKVEIVPHVVNVLVKPKRKVKTI